MKILVAGASGFIGNFLLVAPRGGEDGVAPDDCRYGGRFELLGDFHRYSGGSEFARVAGADGKLTLLAPIFIFYSFLRFSAPLCG
jgi:hypothetical protein